jgi:parvulin-like peptidyl-prolyl isomerase
MRRQFERSYVAMEYVRSLIKTKIDAIDRTDLLEYYRKNPKEFDRPETVKWQHIFLDVDRFPNPTAARAKAESLLAQVQSLKRDEDFAALAEEHSHGPSRYRKGEGEGTRRGQIRPPEVEQLVWSLKPGQAGPIVETSRGFHIVRVIEHQPGGRVPFEVACPDIRRKLQNQMGQDEYKRLVKELRAKAHIEGVQSP